MFSSKAKLLSPLLENYLREDEGSAFENQTQEPVLGEILEKRYSAVHSRPTKKVILA